ncbi:vicilin-like seed storage protein At2g18540 [Benincasa hispida]|uniref:vicilin-like seed storage protein At2g18540 n=1 Tax=Benincasa hispida TaxID=102211 RepID=UPI001901C80C|nr:vicilin-like seed storage protein At2g18540 [Benincasa hispida]
MADQTSSHPTSPSAADQTAIREAAFLAASRRLATQARHTPRLVGKPDATHCPQNLLHSRGEQARKACLFDEEKEEDEVVTAVEAAIKDAIVTEIARELEKEAVEAVDVAINDAIIVEVAKEAGKEKEEIAMVVAVPAPEVVVLEVAGGALLEDSPDAPEQTVREVDEEKKKKEKKRKRENKEGWVESSRHRKSKKNKRDDEDEKAQKKRKQEKEERKMPRRERRHLRKKAKAAQQAATPVMDGESTSVRENHGESTQPMKPPQQEATYVVAVEETEEQEGVPLMRRRKEDAPWETEIDTQRLILALEKEERRRKEVEERREKMERGKLIITEGERRRRIEYEEMKKNNELTHLESIKKREKDQCLLIASTQFEEEFEREERE